MLSGGTEELTEMHACYRGLRRTSKQEQPAGMLEHQYKPLCTTRVSQGFQDSYTLTLAQQGEGGADFQGVYGKQHERRQL